MAQRILAIEIAGDSVRGAVAERNWNSLAMLEVVEKQESLLIFPANFEGIERSSRAIYAGGSVNQVVLPAVRWCFDALKARKFYVIGTEEVWSRVASELGAIWSILAS